MALQTLILQTPGSAETRAAMAGATMMDAPVTVLRCSLEGLSATEVVAQIKSGAALVVGSVEFAREAMRLGGFAEPDNLSYPPELTDYLCRHVKSVRAGQVLGNWFVKPQATKAFTGFLFDTMADPDSLSEDVRPEYDAFMALPADAPVWISEPVSFVSEWRFYVRDQKIIGRGRYDPEGADDAPAPDSAVVESAIQAFGARHPYAIDFGVLAGGETALVEVNDAWAIGLYGSAMPQRDYVNFLWARWEGLSAPCAVVAEPRTRSRKP